MTENPSKFKLFYKHGSHPQIEGKLGSLIRLLGLDSYDTSLLGSRARIEMRFAAILLVIVFCFDMGAWTLLFNSIFHSEILALGRLTPLAVMAAFLISITILIYERQFLTADTTRGWRKLLLPMLMRVVVIIAAAVITAQPVELLFFREAIRKRVNEEGIRNELKNRDGIIQMLALIRDYEANIPDATEKRMESEPVQAKVAELESSLKQVNSDELAAYKKRLVAESNLKTAKDNFNAAAKRKESSKKGRDEAVRYFEECSKKERSAFLRMESAEKSYGIFSDEFLTAKNEHAKCLPEKDLSENKLKSAESQFERSSLALEKISNDVNRLKGIINEVSEIEMPLIESQKSSLDSQLEGSVKERREIMEKIREEEKDKFNKREGAITLRLQNWSTLLQGSDIVGEKVSEKAPGREELEKILNQPFIYEPPQYDFFEQLRVLKDLRGGKPPRWLGITKEKMEYLSKKYGLEDLDTAGDNKKDIFYYSWLAIFGIALIIPILIIAMKFLMIDELKAYYSSDFQAAAGNPDAVTYSTVLGSIKKENVPSSPIQSNPR